MSNNKSNACETACPDDLVPASLRTEDSNSNSAGEDD